MNKLLTAMLIAATACGGSQNLETEARAALPSAETAQVGSPRASAQASRPQNGDSIQQDSTVGSSSQWFNVTVAVAGTFNVGTLWVLTLLENVTANPATSCDQATNSCTWQGSGALDANVFRLVVTKKSDGTFHYELAGEPKSNPSAGFIVFLTGDATPGAQPHHGSGSFVIDFEKAQQLDRPSGDHGSLSVTYTNVGPAHVTATFLGAKDDTDATKRNNLAYDYANDAQGGGQMQIAIHKYDDSRFSIHSRWKNDGEGRADVEAQGVSGSNPYDAHVSECWGAAPFNVVYFSSDFSIVFGNDSGVETSCAYAPASFSSLQVQ